MSSRKLDDIDLEIRAIFFTFEHELQMIPMEFVRACTYRSNEEQEKLYDQGRSDAGRIVTWCRAGQSEHNRTKSGFPASRAADYYPLMNGKLAGIDTQAEHDLWEKMGETAEKFGIEWGGRWPKGKQDRPHFQIKQE